MPRLADGRPENGLMITDAIRQLTRVTFIFTAALVLMPGILWGVIVGDASEITPILVALGVYAALIVAATILMIVSVHRSDKALMQEVVSASPAIAGRQPVHTVPNPARIVRSRISGRRNAFVTGYAPVPPPALVTTMRVISPDGPRLAIALAPKTAISGRARSYIGVRLDPAHPDVAVLDPLATPEEMRVQYEAAMALPGSTKPSIGWGSTTRWTLYGLAAGLSAGFVIGLLLP